VPKFRKVAVGGTFDTLHKGHRTLLREAFLQSEKVIIGLTTDRLAAELYKTHRVDPYERREKALADLLEREGVISRASIIPIDSREGSAAEIPDLEAIIVSCETLPGASAINELRRQRGLKELEVVTIGKVLAADGKPISSTRIRSGEIDQEGRLLSP